MKTALDTNILSAIWMNEPSALTVATAMEAAKNEGSLVVSPPAYAETLANPSYSVNQIHDFLQDAEITLDLPLLDTVWREAGLRYAQYAAASSPTSSSAPTPCSRPTSS